MGSSLPLADPVHRQDPSFGYAVVVTTPLAPGFLVALDTLLDPSFRRTVVLMIHHDEDQGAFGLVINRGTEFSATDLCDSLEITWRGAGDAKVDWGGPVQQDQGWIVFRESLAEVPESEEVAPRIHWSGSREALRHVAENPETVARIFLGSSGWGPGQLEGEIASGAWLVVPIADGLVFDTPMKDLWTATIRSLGIEPATLVTAPGIN